MLSLAATAQTPSDSTSTPKRKNLVGRVINYFENTNDPRPTKNFDWSIIGGPFYSSDTKLGIGLVAAALYHHEKTDTIIQPSSVALKAQLSTTLFYSFAIEGTHIFPHDRMRINYETEFLMLPTYSWGIGYVSDTDDSNKVKYRDMSVILKGEFIYRAVGNLFVGALADFYYTKTRDIKDLSLWSCSPTTATDFGLGVLLTYDTRDVITEARRGWLLTLRQSFFPKWLGNSTHSYMSTEFMSANYAPVWKGGVVATRLRAELTYGDTPWMRMPTIGGNTFMRGYYEGRYRDKSVLDATVELRQHVWKRSGLVVWGGVASLFDSPRDIMLKRLLPNGGVGYRFEFKRRVNIRLDVGFGRKTWGVEFGVNEAF